MTYRTGDNTTMDDENDRAARLHASSIIIDGLEISRFGEEVFGNLVTGGLAAIVATVAVIEGFRDTISKIAAWYRMFDRFSSLIMPVSVADDIPRAKELGKVGIVLGFQNTSPIEDDLHLLSIYKQLGIRVIQLTYMERNFVGDGCLERTDCGLSNFGLEVIEEMNRLGILIDLSHVGTTTALEAIEVSDSPVAYTHANPRTLCDHPRNKTDEEIVALAAKGGVIGANIFPPFLRAGSEATIDDFMEVIDYLVELVGVDHVGIGTDFTEGQPDEIYGYWARGKSKREDLPMKVDLPIVNPEGIRSASQFQNLTKALLLRGYGEADVKKIMGENWLQLFKRVWK
jgi:membrane dipeptidase